MSALVPFRCVQGVGGGLLLCSSLPMFAGTARPGDSPLNGWSAAAAIGMAAGPALGGILTRSSIGARSSSLKHRWPRSP